jgi:hypothetical protein
VSPNLWKRKDLCHKSGICLGEHGNSFKEAYKMRKWSLQRKKVNIIFVCTLISVLVAILGLPIIQNYLQDIVEGPDIKIFLSNDLNGLYEIPYVSIYHGSTFSVKAIVKNRADTAKIVTLFFDETVVNKSLKINPHDQVEVKIIQQIPINGSKEIRIKARDAEGNWYNGPTFRILYGTWYHSIWISSSEIRAGENITIKVFVNNEGCEGRFKIYLELWELSSIDDEFNRTIVYTRINELWIKKNEAKIVIWKEQLIKAGAYFFKTYVVRPDLPYLNDLPGSEDWQQSDQHINTLILVFPKS